MTAAIRSYHAHVYFDVATRDVAVTVRDAITAQGFEVTRMVDGPIGPHFVPMFQVAFQPAEFARIVPWLMLNRAGLSVLVHPNTGDDVADHSMHPLWLGPHQPLDLEFLRREFANR